MVYGETAMPKHASDMQEHTGNPACPPPKCLSPTVGKETFFMLRRNQSRTETHRNSSSQMNITWNLLTPRWNLLYPPLWNAGVWTNSNTYTPGNNTKKSGFIMQGKGATLSRWACFSVLDIWRVAATLTGMPATTGTKGARAPAPSLTLSHFFSLGFICTV